MIMRECHRSALNNLVRTCKALHECGNILLYKDHAVFAICSNEVLDTPEALRVLRQAEKAGARSDEVRSKTIFNGATGVVRFLIEKGLPLSRQRSGVDWMPLEAAIKAQIVFQCDIDCVAKVGRFINRKDQLCNY